ncbi:aminotransferase class V-fold PLP-dependent enzyme [Zunongwangia endophytica]|uniref:Aminotransferase class V-fold PLP-dependent enzyme n=1 Tax=Zunongwangia endophytica TaxID=1808945 RepID=A0ABV8H8G5_9FLAO|nr:aminotransferase class V-fold PLP-dependent enzyme [Zunongwangia endophytica]MDN3595253.1 aminotransferase class V-fold PLP-dependent enzyme [Zunongwangia endophytica]
MSNLRKGFPVLERYTYLNTAASGLLNEKVLEFRQEHDLDFLISASVLKENQGKVLTGVREQVGETFNCAPNRVGLVPNFSYGFNTLLEGLEKTKKVLLLKNDYPSINWPVESRNFKTCYAEINEFLEENIVEVLKKEQPDFFAFSIVQYINGVKLSIAFLTQLKKDFPDVVFIADGTQYLGTEAFDFDASGIDVVISSTYKWINAGYGNGFMLFNKDIEGKVAPKHVGFGSLQGKYKAEEGNFLGKFEPGHQDTLNFGSLGEALKLIKQIGISTIESQVNLMKLKAKDIFTEMNLLEDTVLKRGDHSSIFNIKGGDKLFQYLRSKDIIVSQRGEGLRVSFHYFNTEEELDVLVKAIKNFKG